MLKVPCRVLLNFAELQYWINSKLGTPSRDFSWLVYIRLYILLLYPYIDPTGYQIGAIALVTHFRR